MTNDLTDEPTLVVGGTGKTGRRVVERLRARGVPTRVGSRSAVPPFDWEDRSTWSAAVAGARAAYITYYPDVAAPGSLDAVGTLAKLAMGAGVGHLVLLSGRGEPEAERVEAAVRAVTDEAGGRLTVVRAAWFAQNFSEGFFLGPVQEGVVAVPANDTPEPFVDADDIADVVVAALTEDGHAGETYDVTGPRALPFRDAVATIAATSGRDVAFVPVGLEDYARGARDAGVPDDAVEVITFLFGELLDGRNAHPGDGVRRALGREATDFRDFAARAASAGAWA